MSDISAKLQAANSSLHHGVVENAVGPWFVRIDADALLEIAETTRDAAAEIDRLKAGLDQAVKAHPFHGCALPEAEYTGDDMVDRLRGIYRQKINDGDGLLNGKDYWESRFAVGALSLDAADRIESLKAELAEARKDSARLDYVDKSYSLVKAAYDLMYGNLSFRAALDAVAAEEATWLSR